jgi:uncharacterized membrane protein YccC
MSETSKNLIGSNQKKILLFFAITIVLMMIFKSFFVSLFQYEHGLSIVSMILLVFLGLLAIPVIRGKNREDIIRYAIVFMMVIALLFILYYVRNSEYYQDVLPWK